MEATFTWEIILRDLVPLISAQFFVGFLIYFTLVRRSIRGVYPYYVLFSIALIVFLGGRMLSHFPLGIDYIQNLYVRIFFLFSVGLPSLSIVTGIQSGISISKKWHVAFYSFGLLIFSIYLVFRDAATERSLVGLFHIPEDWNFQLHHAHIVQFIGTLLLLVLPCFYFFLKERNAAKPSSIQIGAFALGAFLLIGTALEQWWIYYCGSVICILFFGKEVIKDLQEMRLKEETLAPLVREELLHNPNPQESNISKLKELLRGIGMKRFPNQFLIIKADETYSYPSNQSSYHLKTLVNEFTSTALKGRSLIIPSDSFHVVLWVHEDDQQADEISSKAEKLREFIKQRSGKTVSIGIGQRRENPRQLRSSHEEAFTAAQYAARVGSNMVVRHSDIHPTQLKGDYPSFLREQFIQSVKQNRIGIQRECISQLINKLLDFSNGNLELCKQRTHEVLFLLSEDVAAAGVSAPKVFDALDTQTAKITNAASLAEVEQLVSELAEAWTEQVEEIPEARVDDFVQRAIDYLTLNFKDPEFSVDKMASQLNVSRSYLMGMFKKSQRKTINQYLTDLRIEESKKLLLSKPITEVAFEVGFNSSNYFATVFKKQVGSTPKQFVDGKK